MTDLLNLQELSVTETPALADTTPTKPKLDDGELIPMDSPVAVEDIPTPAASTHDAVDLTLLRGLEPAMSHEEQAKVTTLLTSGNPGDLAAAAKVLYELGCMLRAGIASPARRSDYQQLAVNESFVPIAPTPNSAKQLNHVHRAGFTERVERVMEEKKVNDVDKAERSHALPLPVRIPRYVVLSSFDASVEKNKKKPLTFLDHPWDGTLGSAFTKMEVHPDGNSKGLRKFLPSKKTKGNSHVDQDIQFSPGFDKIVDRMKGGYSARLIEGLDGDAVNRVLIASVAQEAAKLGLQRGDVITHVNGQEFNGNAGELNRLLASHFEQDKDGKLEIVVNAEICVAQALKLRTQE